MILVTCDVNDEKYDDYTINMYKRFLDARDFERYFNMQDALRKKVFLISRGELRSKLGALMHMEPSEIHFTYNAAGKPFITNYEQEAKALNTRGTRGLGGGAPRVDSNYLNFSSTEMRLYFSIAHTGCLIALVISSQEIGIDIEAMKARNFSKISQKLFNKEITDPTEFYKTWTINEAIAKCEGISLLTQAKSYNIEAYDISHAMYQNAMITIASRKMQ